MAWCVIGEWGVCKVVLGSRAFIIACTFISVGQDFGLGGCCFALALTALLACLICCSLSVCCCADTLSCLCVAATQDYPFDSWRGLPGESHSWNWGPRRSLSCWWVWASLSETLLLRPSRKGSRRKGARKHSSLGAGTCQGCCQRRK